MTALLTRIRGFLTFCLALVFLVNVFVNSPTLKNLNLILLVIVLVLCFPVVTGSSRAISYASIAIGALLLLYYQAPLHFWIQALEESLFLIVLFVLVPLLGIPIEHGGYFKALQGYFQRHIHTERHFYLFVSSISAFIGVLVNLAVVPLVHQISRASEKSKNPKLLSTAISRGFTSTTIWSPTTVAVALIVKITGVEWTTFFPYGLLCGLICGVIGYGLSLFENRHFRWKETLSPQQEPGIFERRKIGELGAFGFFLLFSVLVISLITGIQAIIVVSIIALIFPLFWMGLIKRLKIFLRAVRNQYFKERLPKLKNETMLFVGASFLATGISYSHVGEYIPFFLNYIVSSSPLLLSLTIIFFSTIFALFGVHPVIIVTVIGSTVKAAAYNVSPTFMALTLAISWAMSITVSPSAATLIAVSGVTGESPLTAGLRWNFAYVLLTIGVLVLTLNILRLLGFI